MSVLLERPEITPFLSTWKDKSPEQVAEELASYSLETKRIPDPYHFLVSESGELWSPTAQCRVRDAVLRIPPVGELEYQALTAIEQWVRVNNKGAIVWVSPPYPGIYPTSKVIISEIELEGGIKKLFNRALILDFDEVECLKFAQDLSNFSQNRPLLSSIHEVRATPLILNTKGRSWIYILQELIVDPVLWQMVRLDEDKKAKEEALIQARVVYQTLADKNMPMEDAGREILGMLGDKSVSCPLLAKAGTAFQVFSTNSLAFGTSGSTESDSKGPRKFPCPACGYINTRPYEGYVPSCQNPGICRNRQAVKC